MYEHKGEREYEEKQDLKYEELQEKIKNAEKEYDSHNEQNLILHFNLSNLIALIGKVYY